jgi:hypothetical protein
VKPITGTDYFNEAVSVELAEGPHKCPVCAEFEFSEQGSYEICEVCDWEDDPVQLTRPDLAGGANQFSLIQARKLWQDSGKKTK